jgi:hypothetical protein
MQALRLNNSGVMVFRPDIFQTSGVIQGAIFKFDGTTLTQLVSGADLAPGGGGAPFGRNITVGDLNDSGDVAFTVPLLAAGSAGTSQTTLYVKPGGGGAPVRVAGVGDVAPSTGGGTLINFNLLSFNNLGDICITRTAAAVPARR